MRCIGWRFTKRDHGHGMDLTKFKICWSSHLESYLSLLNDDLSGNNGLRLYAIMDMSNSKISENSHVKPHHSLTEQYDRDLHE